MKGYWSNYTIVFLEDVKTIKEAVSDVSLEKKVGRAIENIENKLEKLTDLICSQSESTYYSMASTEVSSCISDT